MVLEVTQNGTPFARIELPASDFAWTLGRQEGCDVRLPANEVSRVHARLTGRSGVFVLSDAGSRGGTWSNGQRLESALCLAEGDRVKIGPYQIGLVAAPTPVAQRAAPPSRVPPPSSPGPVPQPQPPPDIGEAFKNAVVLYTDECMKIKRRLHEHILAEMNLSEDALKEFADETMKDKLETCLDATLRQFRHELPSSVTVPVFRQALLDELVGYGPLSPILRMP